IASGGVLNNTGSIGNAFGGGFVVQSGGTFNNSGSFLSDYLSSFGSQANSAILNTGDMSLGGNTVAIGGSLRNNGTITMVAGPATGDPAIQPPAPPLLITSTGKLSGTGTVNQGLFGFGVINQGVMAPGDPLGTFTIVGNYQQTATGTLDILLGGVGTGQFGQLDITGGADLSGTLDVELFAGFDPQAGAIFEILESGGITNLDFMSMLFPTLPDGLFFKLDQEGGNLFLDVMQGEGGGGTPVPEPSTGVLLLGAIATMFCASLRRKRLSTPRS
ncbi:MAG: PEP-CTERM sorting domain-containing protein, partial [Candidatus Acidiferrales bacterium]